MLKVAAYSDGDDVLIAWEPDVWAAAWVGFQIERRDQVSQAVTMLNNRIPPKPGAGPPPAGGLPSSASPIRRCIWTDHAVTDADQVSYRVTAMVERGEGFAEDPAGTSEWTSPVVVTGDFGQGLAAYFNRGTLMSQVVSRFVGGDVSSAALRRFTTQLRKPGNPARRYLSGDARHHLLSFLGDADRRGNSIFAALYEINDQELIEALKPFGPRGRILIGNGGATGADVAQALADAGLEVHHRDLSHHGASSPSVHNKFVVEADAGGTQAVRVLTGSTNWTVTGLCTQLNNVLIVSRPKIAARFLEQWTGLVKAGDDLTPALKAANAQPVSDGPVTVYFAATPDKQEFEPVLELIRGARQGALFLMFMPGQSPLLAALLDRAREDRIYVRGVVSTVGEKGDGIVEVGGQVVKSGSEASAFHNQVLVPANVPPEHRPDWAMGEFSAGQIHAAKMMAIVHTKAIVVDPFSDDCAVVTGSHNFSDSASAKNDENLVIVRGDRALAQAYAVHMSGVYDGYAWRAFLNAGATPGRLYRMAGWKPGGARHRELSFWMS